jgi:hypothetical protein
LKDPNSNFSLLVLKCSYFFLLNLFSLTLNFLATLIYYANLVKSFIFFHVLLVGPILSMLKFILSWLKLLNFKKDLFSINFWGGFSFKYFAIFSQFVVHDRDRRKLELELTELASARSEFEDETEILTRQHEIETLQAKLKAENKALELANKSEIRIR